MYSENIKVNGPSGQTLLVMKVWTQDYMLTLRIVFDLFKFIQSIFSHKWAFEVYNMLTVAQIKSNKVLLLRFSLGDTKYPQKQGKFTTFEALFDLYGCFVYIITLQIFRNLAEDVSVIYIKLITAEDLGLWGRPMRDTIIYWRCVQFRVKWARSHAFRSTISRSPTSTLAVSVILFLNQRHCKTHLFNAEFVNLGAKLNILLSKQYIPILKNHCIANKFTETQL